MTGEKLGWFQVASHLGYSVAELRARITYSEFIDWLTFLRREEERNTKQDIYLAQIAAEIRRGLVKNPKSVKTKDFLMNKTDAPTKVEKPPSKSKSAWMRSLNMKIGGS